MPLILRTIPHSSDPENRVSGDNGNLASFTHELWQLYLTQGVRFGVGCAFAYRPAVTLPSQRFTKSQALATGIAVSGSDMGDVAVSPLNVRMIALLGYRDAFWISDCLTFACVAIAAALAVSQWKPSGAK